MTKPIDESAKPQPETKADEGHAEEIEADRNRMDPKHWVNPEFPSFRGNVSEDLRNSRSSANQA